LKSTDEFYPSKTMLPMMKVNQTANICLQIKASKKNPGKYFQDFELFCKNDNGVEESVCTIRLNYELFAIKHSEATIKKVNKLKELFPQKEEKLLYEGVEAAPSLSIEELIDNFSNWELFSYFFF